LNRKQPSVDRVPSADSPPPRLSLPPSSARHNEPFVTSFQSPCDNEVHRQSQREITVECAVLPLPTTSVQTPQLPTGLKLPTVTFMTDPFSLRSLFSPVLISFFLVMCGRPPRDGRLSPIACSFLQKASQLPFSREDFLNTPLPVGFPAPRP